MEDEQLVVIKRIEDKKRKLDQLQDNKTVFHIGWQGNNFQVELSEKATVFDLKNELEIHTKVRPERQKLVGLIKGKLPHDFTVLSTIFKEYKPKSVMMVGSTEEVVTIDKALLKELVDDIGDMDFSDYLPSTKDITDESAEKLKQVIEKTKISLISPISEHKKLLVMDLDYTVFDCKSDANSMFELLRPGTLEFLGAMHEHFDIAFWSQRQRTNLIRTLNALGIMTDPSFTVTMVLDISMMVAVHHSGESDAKRHQVKPLEVIWSKFPNRYGPHNTVHVDDLSRNFTFNPANGIKVSAFKNKNRRDRELLNLAQFLIARIVDSDDVRTVDLKNWKRPY